MMYDNLDTARQITQLINDCAADVAFADGEELKINGGLLTINGLPLSEDATKHMLDNLQVRKGFIKTVGPGLESWDEVSAALSGVFRGKKLAYQIAPDGKRIQSVQSVAREYSSNVYKDAAHALAVSVSEVTDRDIKMVSGGLANGNLVMQFVNNEVWDLPFGEAWKTGQQVTVDLFGVKLEPFYQRVICSNGMVRTIRTDVYTTKHDNMKKAEQLFIRKIGVQDWRTKEILTEAIRNSKGNNASLREFYAFKDAFTESEQSGTLQRAVQEKFDEAPIRGMYGEDLRDKSPRWQSTVDTGINSFDLINTATYIASRGDEFMVAPVTCERVQRLAAKIMFAEPDLMHVARRLN